MQTLETRGINGHCLLLQSATACFAGECKWKQLLQLRQLFRLLHLGQQLAAALGLGLLLVGRKVPQLVELPPPLHVLHALLQLARLPRSLTPSHSPPTSRDEFPRMPKFQCLECLKFNS
jgi:hypothetical protein